MSVFITLHADSLRIFLTKLKEDRNTLICDYEYDYRILNKVGLKGNEQRPFTDSEIDAILATYAYFKDWFKEKGLWPSK